MLKEALVGGPSLVLTCKHVRGENSIPLTNTTWRKITKHILGFDAKSLYPSTTLKEMPCGKERVVHYDEPEQAAKDFARKVRTGMWFGFAEVDIEVPREL